MSSHSNASNASSPSVSDQSDQGVQPDVTMVGRPLPKKRVSRAKAPPKDDNTVEKKKTTRGKRTTGKLAALLDLPLDCLFDIFGHLMPADLLHLSRATKSFRAVLLHRSSLSVWKTSFSNAPGLPPCPRELSEPQWANLLFGKNCMACLAVARRREDIAWDIRMRLCSKCLKTYVVPTPADDDEIFTDMVPNYTGPNYDIFKAMYFSLEGEAREAFVVESKENTKLILEHSELCIEWAKSLADARAKELEEIKQARKAAIIERLTALGYGYEIEHDRYLKSHPLVKIPKPLTDRTWNKIKDQMIEHMGQAKAQRLAAESLQASLHRSQELQRSKNVATRKGVLIDMLRNYKQTQNPSREIMPEPFDFCEHDLIEPYIQRGRWRNDLVDIDEMDFDLVMKTLISDWREDLDHAMVQTIMDTWAAYQAGTELPDDCYVDSNSEGSSNDGEDVDMDMDDDQDEMDVDRSTSPVYDPRTIPMARRVLGLAMTVWRCLKCTSHSQTGTRPLFYPKVLAHCCLTGKVPTTCNTKQRRKNSDHDEPYDEMALDNYAGKRTAWSCDSLRLDKKASAIVAGIIRVVGLDPDMTTAYEMDALDVRLGCLLCVGMTNGLKVEETYGWRSAVQHQAEKHAWFPGVVWRLLPPHGRTEAIAYEQHHLQFLAASDPQSRSSKLPSDFIVWVCSHCADTPHEQPPMELNEVFAHLKTAHKENAPIIGRDYFKDLAAPQLYLNDNPFEVGKIVHVSPIPGVILYVPQVSQDYHMQ